MSEVVEVCDYDDDLAIADGNLAAARYQRALASADEAQRQQTFADLRAYCRRDTLATLELRKALAGLVAGPSPRGQSPLNVASVLPR